METLQPGDVLCVASIDSMGRNYMEIQQQGELLTTSSLLFGTLKRSLYGGACS